MIPHMSALWPSQLTGFPDNLITKWMGFQLLTVSTTASAASFRDLSIWAGVMSGD